MSRRKRYTRNFGRRLPTPLPVRATTEWVRFEHEREPYGVFCYLDDAKEAKPELGREIDTILDWFEYWLFAPRFVDVERFWFKVEASHYVAQARRLMELVRMAGIPIVERRIRRVPGIVSWNDAHQVAVVTFRDTPRVATTR